MSGKSKRRVPPRPQVVPESLRQQLTEQLGGRNRVLNREQCMFVVTSLAANLERMLNNHRQLPWVTSHIEKRSDGFTLNVQIIEPSTDTDAVVV